MSKDKFSKEMDQKFNALWEQSIESQKRNIEHYKKIKNKEMEEFAKDVLKKMEKRYEEVKIKT